MTRSIHRFIAPFLCAALLLGGSLVQIAVSADPAAAATPISDFTVSSTDTTSVIGQSVNFVGTLTGTSTAPTGTLTFLDGATPICPPVSLQQLTPTFSGAECASADLTLGSHTITATYSGDVDYDGADSTTFHPALAQEVAPASTTTTAFLSGGTPDPTVVSQTVVINASIAVTAPGSGAPTGTVAFQSSGVDIVGCEAKAVTGGAASCSTTGLAWGGQSITATYSGDADFATSSSTGFLHTVGQASTTTAVTSSDTTTNWLDPVTYTATVSPTSPATIAPSAGTVSFRVNGTPITGCTVQPVTTGAATCATTSEPIGTPSITAVYSGDGNNYATSTATGMTQTVATANSTTTVTSSDSTTVASESVTLTATVAPVAPASATPTGTVAFTVNATPITGCAARPLATGVATCPTSALPVGAPDSIVATYTGDASYTTSTSPAFSQTVAPEATATVVTQSPATTVVGQSVTYTATVSPVAPGVALVTSGTVNFTTDGTTIVGCATKAVSSSGVATCTISPTTVGGALIAAVYSGATNFATSTAADITHTVNQAATTVVLTSGTNPSVVSGPLNLTATVSVTSPGTGTPGGFITFLSDGVAISLCNPRTVTAGVATCGPSSLPLGAHDLTATYTMSTDYLASTSPVVVQTVNAASTTTAVISSDTTTSRTEAVTFTATVTPTAPATVTPTTGTVSFKAGGTAISGCATQAITAGAATCTTSLLPVGAASITAVYSGVPSYTTSTSPAITQTVGKTATVTALVSDHNPSRSGQAVTLTATVTSAAGQPTGTVLFYQVERDSSHTLLDSAPLTAGVASITTSAMHVRIGTVIADYNGSASYAASTHTSPQTVSRSFSLTLMRSSQKRSTLGQAVTFTVTVASEGEGSGTPTGKVELFNLDGTPMSLGTAKLKNGVATFTMSDIPVGTHKIGANYLGSETHRESKRTMTQTVSNP